VDFVMVEGRTVMESGTLTAIDERAIVAEIAAEHARLKVQFDVAEASVGPIMGAMQAVYKRSLATTIPADTYPARLP
jgi:guanine deaminase